MRKIFLLVVFGITGVLSYQSIAQSDLYVKLQDGTVQNFPLTSLQKITFSGANVQLNEKEGDMSIFDMSLVSILTFAESSLSVESVYAGEFFGTVYPNPATDFIYIKDAAGKEADITIYDMNGSLVLAKRVDTTQAIDVSSLPTGMYLIKIDGRISKFIKL